MVRNHKLSIKARLESDKAAFLALPAVPFEPCDKRAGKVSSTSFVRYRNNDYSVPVRFGHRDVIVKGFVDEIVICIGNDIIARHTRSYDTADYIANPLHYLPLIEQKLGALDQALPLAGWDLPVAFGILRRLMESRLGKSGKREYVQVLQLLGYFDQADLTVAVQQALSLGVISFDAIKQLALCRVEKRPPRLDLSLFPYLPLPSVGTTRARDYAVLTSDFRKAA